MELVTLWTAFLLFLHWSFLLLLFLAAATSEERLYEVRDLRFPDGVAGALRRAAEADRELLLSWLPRFEAGAGWAGSNPAAIFVTRRLAAGDVWIWDDDGPVSMALTRAPVVGVARAHPAESDVPGVHAASVAGYSQLYGARFSGAVTRWQSIAAACAGCAPHSHRPRACRLRLADLSGHHAVWDSLDSA